MTKLVDMLQVDMSDEKAELRESQVGFKHELMIGRRRPRPFMLRCADDKLSSTARPCRRSAFSVCELIRCVSLLLTKKPMTT